MTVAICLLSHALVFAQTQTDFERECARLAAADGRDADRLHQLFKLEWEHTMHEQPEFATRVGYPGQNDRWSDRSPEAIERRKREPQAPLKVLRSIRRAELNNADQLNYDLFLLRVEQAIAGARFPEELLPVNQMAGVQQELARLVELAPRATAKDYQDLVTRLQSADRVIEQTLVLLRQGLAAGITPPRITLRDVPQQVKNQMVENVAQSPLLRPLKDFPETIPASEQERLRTAASAAVKDKIIPAYAKLHEFLVDEYLPKSRERIACLELPEGKAWYEHKVRVSTTTTMTPDQIHELGMAEVQRIRAEMEKVKAEAGFAGSLKDFFTFLREDPRFYYADAEELLRGYRDISKRADPELARLFRKLPRLPYGVLPVPAYAEKSMTTAYYQPGSLAAGRAGNFFANTYALNTRPKWEMEALTLHEAVPGHHLQIALAQELDYVPEFRKHGMHTAYVEGWGLYAESLGYEMGFFRDPYMKFGQLVYEMWRAIRLVVDTGMHAKDWTRQQAIGFFLDNASKNEHDVTVEVDRYIVWPGQALAYKIGQLKIRELREHATRELGDRFDVRAFHDEILGQGSLPLDLLEQRIKEWVKARQAGNG